MQASDYMSNDKTKKHFIPILLGRTPAGVIPYFTFNEMFNAHYQ